MNFTEILKKVVSSVGNIATGNIDKVVDSIFPDKEKQAVEREKLDLEIKKLILEEKKVVASSFMEEMKLSNDNRADAREQNEELQKDENVSEIAKKTPYIIAWISFILLIMVSFGLFFLDIPTDNKDILYILIGAIISNTNTILNFFFGDSIKTKQIKK